MIEVGEYVRTIGGYIIKYKNKNENIFNCDNKQYIESSLFPDEEQIVKHSKNIIDLIEEGDYVNGERVLCFKDKDNCDYDIGTEYSDDFGEYFGFNKEDIKSIVTKESFKNAEYRVEAN